MSWTAPASGISVTANQAVIANGTGTGLTNFTCPINQAFSFDGAGLPTCQAMTPAGGFINGGNSFGAAATLGTNDNYDLNFETNNLTQMTIKNSGRIGIGTSTPGAKLEVANNYTNTSGAQHLLRSLMYINPTGNSTASFYGYTSEVETDGSSNISNPIYGSHSTIFHYGTGNAQSLTSGQFNLFTNASSPINTGRALGAESYVTGSAQNVLAGDFSLTLDNSSLVSSLTGTQSAISVRGSSQATNVYGIKIDVEKQVAATVANSYGLYIEDVQGTNAFGIYQFDLTNKNYFAGNVGIGNGVTTPSSVLDVNGAITQRGMAAPAVSSAGQGRIYFFSTSNKFRVSQNGGAYADLVASGGSGDILNGGNSFGANATLGTNDNFALNFETNGTTKMTVLANGNVGIGTASPSYPLDIQNTTTITTGTQYGAQTQITHNPSSSGLGSSVVGHHMRASKSALQTTNALAGSVSLAEVTASGMGNNTFTVLGSQGISTVTGAGSFPDVRGVSGDVSINSTGNAQGSAVTGSFDVNSSATVNFANGGQFDVTTNAAGSYINTAFGVLSEVKSLNGTINEAYGLFSSVSKTSGTVNEGYGLYISAITGILNYGIYQSSITNQNYFAGNVGIGNGVTTPSSALDVNGAITQRGMAAPAVSPAGQGRIYFDSTSNTFRVSQNGGAYVDLVNTATGGITSLGGQTGGTQTFAVNATGTAPAINSSSDTHTLSIPLASGAGVTSGTISKTDYDSFVAKLTSPLTTKGDLLVHDGSTHVRLPAGTDSYILRANSATASGLEWVAAPTGDITSVVAGAGLTTGGTSGDVTLNVGAGTGIIVNANDVAVDVGLGANKIPQVGGTALGANGVVVTSGIGAVLTSLNCTLDQVIKFDVSGYATCGTDSTTTTTEFINGGNSFGAAATLGTNDNYDLNFETNSTTKMTVLSDGKMGVGVTSPVSRLDIRTLGAAAAPATSGTTQSTGHAIRIESGANAILDIGMNTASGAWLQSTHAGSLAINYSLLLNPNGGNVGIGVPSPSYALDVAGDIRITGTPYRASGDIAWTVPSDSRLKDVTGKYKYGLREIASLETIQFKYKKDNAKNINSDNEYTGVLAQEVQKLIPNAVKQEVDGFLSLNTTPIFWAMVNAIKELFETKADLSRVQILESENEKLKQENTMIKAYLCEKDPQALFCN